MTKAELITAVRQLVNEVSTDAGAALADDGNLLGFLEDAVEQVVMDLVTVYPNELLTHEEIDIVANQQEYELATEFWQVLKVEKTVSGEAEAEFEIADPLSTQFLQTHDETADRPYAANVINGILIVYPKPSVAIQSFVRVWGIQAETVSIGDNGPSVLPRPAHRLIVFWAAFLVATMFGATKSAQSFMLLYQNRLDKLKAMQNDKMQQAPRFVRDSVVDRTLRDTRDPTTYDRDWP